jgi:putative ABC transport system permease protein
VLGEVVNRDGQNFEIVGVVKDFVHSDFYAAAPPLILFSQPSSTNFMFVRIKQGVSLPAALAQIESVVKSQNPGYPFEYRFMDEEFHKQFQSEMLVEKLSRIFAGLAIFISCLGLFGLAAYTAERRTKEIGIRKVLGASVAGIAGLLSLDFLKLVFLSFLIAFPLAWYFMDQWLQDFAYRVSISWTIFLFAGVAALAVALLTISFQAVKAALANPVRNLRTE